MTANEENMNPAAGDLYRQTLRKLLFTLLNDVDMPGDKAQLGRAWLQEKRRSLQAMHDFKDRIIQVRDEHREHKQKRRAEKAAA